MKRSSLNKKWVAVYDRYKAIHEELGEIIVGHESAKSQLAIAAAEHFFGECRPEPGQPRVTLLTGPTGVGKTQLCQSLAEILDVRFGRVDAGLLTPPGYHGLDLDQMLTDFIVERPKAADQKGDPEKESPTQFEDTHGILLLDEFDKVAVSAEGPAGNHEKYQNALQVSLLSLFEGRPIPLSKQYGSWLFDSSKLLILAAGCFDGRKLGRSRNFGSLTPPSKRGMPDSDLTHGDLIKLGIMPELAGRIRAIVPLESLSSHHFERLAARLLESDGCSVLGFKLEIECANGVQDLGKILHSCGLGARSFFVVLEKIKSDAYIGHGQLKIDGRRKVITVSSFYLRSSWPSLF